MTVLEINELHTRAVAFAKSKKFYQCNWFYRNKTKEYYDDIKSNHNNIMKVYFKDNNGDQASPINGRLKGLFFGVNVEKSGDLPPISHYGPKRLCIQSWWMFTDCQNLYFVDFYCNKFAHYVTLVMTKMGSKNDKFCRRRLLPLDVSCNDFFWLDPSRQFAWVTSGIWVEVLFTQNIDIGKVLSSRTGDFVFTDYTGTSRPGGLPKNRVCRVCNLYS